MLSAVIFFVLVALGLWVLSVLHKRYYVAQYLYFLRAPIIFSVLTIALPIAAFHPSLKSIVLNWFDLEPVGFIFVALLATLLAWSFMYQFTTIWESVPLRNLLPFEKQRGGSTDYPTCHSVELNRLWSWLADPDEPRTYAPPRIFIFAFVFAGPILMAAFLQSQFRWNSLLWAGAGLAMAYLLWVSFRWLHYARAKMKTDCGNQGNTGSDWANFVSGLDSACQSRITYNVSRALGYLRLSLLVYLVIWFLLDPEKQSAYHDWFPPLGYILLFLTMISWAASVVTLYLDKYRVPVFLVLVILALFSPDDHFYDVVINGTTATEDVAKEVPSAPTPDYAVLVAASGGGITASYWTTVVLEKLHTKFKDKFRVDLLSSVSGGSVGAMFYAAAVDDQNAVDPEKLAEAVDAAGTSSLGEVGWGIVYPDFLRGILKWPFHKDRAWAQEQRWGKELRKLTHSNAIFMNAWGDNHKRPVLAFNTTVAETGQRLVITSHDLFSGDSPTSEPADRQHKLTARERCEAVWRNQTEALSFRDLFPNLDIKMETAARLSATFPYVTPVARMAIPEDSELAIGNECPVAGYHLSDGGYFDNWGIATLLDYIDSLPNPPAEILLVQIRASGPVEEPDAVLPGLTAPILTMLHVRSSSQVKRNETALNYLRRLKKLELDKQTEIHDVVFDLSLDAPLSWHLSKAEQNDIRKALQRSDNLESLQEVEYFLQDK
ncbi:MAG: patatin-like phospholipase family protein [Candidatus Thiodiazotropha sp.]